MEEHLQQLFTFSLTVREAVANILIALVCGIAIAILYRITYRGVGYSASFTNSIIMLTMITALVIMVIGNNVARAFGLVGAMSIIRFRTAVKDSQDIMFIFFSLGIGLAAGVGLYAVTLASTLLIGTAIFVTSKINYSSPPKREFLLQIVYIDDKIGDNPFQQILKKHCSKNKLVNLKGTESEESDTIEASYYIRLKSEDLGPIMVSEVKALTGVTNVNLFFDEN
jgi:uncharacterized membrane protein YhiD involved in acid resistance